MTFAYLCVILSSTMFSTFNISLMPTFLATVKLEELKSMAKQLIKDCNTNRVTKASTPRKNHITK